jgi:hypothetical protein
MGVRPSHARKAAAAGPTTVRRSRNRAPLPLSADPTRRRRRAGASRGHPGGPGAPPSETGEAARSSRGSGPLRPPTGSSRRSWRPGQRARLDVREPQRGLPSGTGVEEQSHPAPVARYGAPHGRRVRVDPRAPDRVPIAERRIGQERATVSPVDPDAPEVDPARRDTGEQRAPRRCRAVGRRRRAVRARARRQERGDGGEQRGQPGHRPDSRPFGSPASGRAGARHSVTSTACRRLAPGPGPKSAP